MKSPLIKNGFTLVELMISIVLGLLIVAAAIQLFITGQTSLNMQRSMADIQDNGNFGLNYLTLDFRKANLDAGNAVANDQTPYGGIVLTSITNRSVNPTTPTVVASANINYAVNVNLLSRGAGQTVGTTGNEWTGASNTGNDKSDQLVIQYKPNQVGTDCEGNNITAADITAGTYIVQRYFLRQDGTNTQDLALACDAGRYTTSKNLTHADYSGTLGYGGAGQIILRRVDYFHVLLGTSEGSFDSPNKFRYMSIKDYMDITLTVLAPAATSIPSPRLRIQSIQIGMLVRASDSVGNDSNLRTRNASSFKVLDKDVTLAANLQNGQYLRQVVSQAVAIRNGMGIRGNGDGL